MSARMRIAAMVLLGLALLGLLLPSLPLGFLKGSKTPIAPPTKPPIVANVPNFIADSAYNFVAAQVAFGPRVVGSKAHKACGEYLIAQLKNSGAEVVKQDFTARVYTGANLPAFNIVGSFNPAALNRIVLAAHWDSRHVADRDQTRQKEPILGADDGGSGVAVLLEVARQLQKQPLNANFGVDIVLFDAEDHGNDDDNTEAGSKTWCLGSQYWSTTPHKPGYRARYGILLDMVGAAGARFAREGVSAQFAPDILDLVWRTALSQGYGSYFVNDAEGGVTDDHLYVNQLARIPMIDIINHPQNSQTGFVPHWHTHNDNLQTIDRNTLKAVGQTLLAVLYNEDAASI